MIGEVDGYFKFFEENSDVGDELFNGFEEGDPFFGGVGESEAGLFFFAKCFEDFVDDVG